MAVATKDDANCILTDINSTFSEVDFTIDDIESNWEGVRYLINEEDKDLNELSRKDELFVLENGLILNVGDKTMVNRCF